MKKITIIAVLVVAVVLLAGCLDYKAYDLPQEDSGGEDLDLLNEIAEIERQLEQNDLVDDDTNSVEKLEVENEEIVVVDEVVEIPSFDEPAADAVVIEVNENELVRLDATVFDPDNDRITYTFGKPLTSTGEWKTEYGDAGGYYVTLSATDGTHTVDQEILLVVNRVNVAPQISPVANMNFQEGDVIDFAPQVLDPNNDDVSVSVSAPLANGRWETDHNAAGEYEIFVTATDGELSSEETFILRVADVNVLPVLSGFEREIQVKEGETVRISPTVEDLDGDTVIISISEPVGNDGVWETSFTDNGQYTVTVVADDGKNQVREVVVLTVVDVNMPPRIVDIFAQTS
jgi:hypothetical protein